MASISEMMRIVQNAILDVVSKRRHFAEGTVIKISDKAKKALVNILPENNPIWCRVSFENGSANSQSGGMPVVGARVLVALLDINKYQYQNPIIIRYLYDSEQTPPEREDSDPNYYAVNPKSGGKIEFYEGDSGHLVKTTATEDYEVNIGRKGVITCDDLYLGEESGSEEIVTKGHLEKHDSLVDHVDEVNNEMMTSMWVCGILGPLPLAVVNPTLFTKLMTKKVQVPLSKDNDTNRSEKTKVDKK